jgi:hypothetical protein
MVTIVFKFYKTRQPNLSLMRLRLTASTECTRCYSKGNKRKMRINVSLCINMYNEILG